MLNKWDGKSVAVGCEIYRVACMSDKVELANLKCNFESQKLRIDL